MTDKMILVDDPGYNSGHGHVFKRTDGIVVRCGGPTMCGECALDDQKRMCNEMWEVSAQKRSTVLGEVEDILRHEIQRHKFQYLDVMEQPNYDVIQQRIERALFEKCSEILRIIIDIRKRRADD